MHARSAMADTGEDRVVVLAMDGSDHSDFAFDWYMKKVYRRGDSVIIGHCIECKTLSNVFLTPGVEVPIKVLEEEEDRIKDRIAEFHRKLDESNVKGTVVRLTGEPGASIVDLARTQNADMIVTGCRGLGQIRRTLMGSVSDFIIHHSDVPVIVCRKAADEGSA